MSTYTAMLDSCAPHVIGTVPPLLPPGARLYAKPAAEYRSLISTSANGPPETRGKRREPDNALRQWHDFKFWGVMPSGVCCLTFVTAASRAAGIGALPQLPPTPTRSTSTEHCFTSSCHVKEGASTAL